MRSYYYRLSGKRILDYSTNGWFKCPVVIKEQKEIEAQRKHYLPDQFKHSNGLETGTNHVTYTTSEKTVLPNGDVAYTHQRILQKATKDRKDLICKCGATMEFVGYHAYIEKTIKEGTPLAGIGTYGGETKRLADRWFKTKSAQQKWVKNELAKDHK